MSFFVASDGIGDDFFSGVETFESFDGSSTGFFEIFVMVKMKFNLL